MARAADALRPVAHARDVPLVVADHYRLVPRLGLDGVHLSDGARQVRAVRKALGKDAIVGAHRPRLAARGDDGGGDRGGLRQLRAGGGERARRRDAWRRSSSSRWWSEMIEVPVVAEGGLTPELAGELAGVADFLALGPEIWSAPEGEMAALAGIVARL